MNGYPLYELMKSYENILIQCNEVETYHMGCWYVGGRRGLDIGVQLYDLIILSANRKLRNRLATNKSCLNNFWNSSIKGNFKKIKCMKFMFTKTSNWCTNAKYKSSFNKGLRLIYMIKYHPYLLAGCSMLWCLWWQ